MAQSVMAQIGTAQSNAVAPTHSSVIQPLANGTLIWECVQIKLIAAEDTGAHIQVALLQPVAGVIFEIAFAGPTRLAPVGRSEGRVHAVPGLDNGQALKEVFIAGLLVPVVGVHNSQSFGMLRWEEEAV
ncbi:hypothetical protein HaLaN_17852 [Haematococcus lacustris]|uniref:Uncharacterized protein n=1 Tax=Haematococcus lacustris TaxID=44745 RepID=A0A699ZHS5_HAELA|nr:hypothetical protein HaLaN_17852 [Haematococcus lacustris]